MKLVFYSFRESKISEYRRDLLFYDHIYKELCLVSSFLLLWGMGFEHGFLNGSNCLNCLPPDMAGIPKLAIVACGPVIAHIGNILDAFRQTVKIFGDGFR